MPNMIQNDGPTIPDIPTSLTPISSFDVLPDLIPTSLPDTPIALQELFEQLGTATDTEDTDTHHPHRTDPALKLAEYLLVHHPYAFASTIEMFQWHGLLASHPVAYNHCENFGIASPYVEERGHIETQLNAQALFTTPHGVFLTGPPPSSLIEIFLESKISQGDSGTPSSRTVISLTRDISCYWGKIDFVRLCIDILDRIEQIHKVHPENARAALDLENGFIVPGYAFNTESLTEQPFIDTGRVIPIFVFVPKLKTVRYQNNLHRLLKNAEL